MSRQFTRVFDKYGAPMGRRQNGHLDVDVPRSVRLFRVRLNSGGYDDGGAYWGIGNKSLWCAIDGDGNRQFVRAFTRAGAALTLNIRPSALIVKLDVKPSEYAQRVVSGIVKIPEGHTISTVLKWSLS